MRETKEYIVLVGDVVNGLRPFGPFPDHTAAFQWARGAEFKELDVPFYITNLWIPS